MRSTVLLVPLLLGAQTPSLYTIHNYAGTSWTGDGRPATAAALIQPSGLAADGAGNLYISDAGDHRVRCVGRDGAIRTVAGTGVPAFTGDSEAATRSALNTPYGVAVDSYGNLFIADLGNGLVRRLGSDGRLVTIAGGGLQTPSPAAGPATKMKLSQPREVAVDRLGNVYIADFGAHQVYQVTPDGSLSVIAGTGDRGAIRGATIATAAPLSAPSAVALDGNGSLYIADSGNRRVRRLSGGWLTTLNDKSGKEVELGTPTGLAIDTARRLYVADGASRLTVVWANGELVSLGIGGTAVALGPSAEVFTIVDRQILRLTGASTTVVAGSVTGPGSGDGSNPSEWRFQSPSAIARDPAGNLYIADTGNGRVRRLSASGELTTLTTRLAAPVSIAVDAQSRVYVGDRASGAVYSLDSGPQPRVIARSEGRTMLPAALAFDSAGHLHIADPLNDVIRRVSADGTMTVVAGGGTLGGDGIGLLLKLGAPSGLAFDSEGGLWFSEARTGRLRRFAAGRVTTMPNILLREPHGIRLDSSGNLLVADVAMHRLLRVAPDGSWLPLAGSGDKGHSGDGEPALAGMLNEPLDAVAGDDGTILIADTGNHRIRQLRPYIVAPATTVPPEEIKLPVLQVVHAGTLEPDSIAPGQLVYVSGDHLSGAEIEFGRVPARIVASAPDRITVQVPLNMRNGIIEVSATAGAEVRGKALIDVTPIAPGILTAAGGIGQALAMNDDGQPNGTAHPAARASIVSLFLTGEGGGLPSVTAEIGGYDADVVWCGPAPGLPGIYQANVRMPGGFAPSGVVSVTLAVEGVRSQPGVTIVSR